MKIVIATGGTGGHIFPALETASVLKDRGHDVYFVGSLGLGEAKVKSRGFPATLITAKGFTNRSLTGIFKFISLMVYGVGQSLGALKQIKPDKVIGFGGYGSFPVVLSAKILNLPIMIHEQNVIPGKANRLLSKLVKKVAISFPETRQYLNVHKTVWTGCPCHQHKVSLSKDALFQKFSLDSHRKTILLLGGSQGSHRLNEVFFEMVSFLCKHKDPMVQDIQAIHMTGKKDYEFYVQQYKNLSMPVKVLDFISPVEEVYTISDVVIARAGAATVSELGFFAIPSILVPYPLADNHQKYNAEALTKLGLAQIIEQKDLTENRLMLAVKNLLSTGFNKEQWQKKTFLSFKESPAQELAKAVEDL